MEDAMDIGEGMEVNDDEADKIIFQMEKEINGEKVVRRVY